MASFAQGLLLAAYQRLNAPFVARRAGKLARLPQVALHLEHTNRGRLLPNRMALLDLMPKHAAVAEIGVADGDFSCEILRRCDPQVLHLIDLWESERYRCGKLKVQTRFATEIARGQVLLRPGYSTAVMQELPAGSLDWAYIDTDHSFATTRQELLEAERIVKEEGHILGHDFCTGSAVRALVYGVVQAVNEFCVTRDWGFDYVALDTDGHFSFCLSRNRTQAERKP